LLDRICLGGNIVGEVAQEQIGVGKDPFSLHCELPVGHALG
jgi:hypothetical protein